MSINKSLSTDGLAPFTIAAMIAFVLVFPFLKIEPYLLFWLLVIFFILLVMFADLFHGLLLLLIIRPILDISSGQEVFSVGPFSVNLAAILGISTIFFGFVAIIKNKQKIKDIPLSWQWLLLLTISFLSISWSFSLTMSVSEWIRIGTIFSIFLLGFLSVKNFQDTLKIAVIIVLSAFIPALFATHQFFTNNGFSLNFEDVPNRVFGTFAHPNPFAYFLSFALALILFFVLKKSNKHRVLSVIYLFSLTSLLVLTYTRGAWLVLIGTILLIGITRYRKLLTLCLVLLIFAYLTISPIQARVNSLIVQGPSSSIKWRLALWEDSISYITERPALGFGIGTSEEVVLQKRGATFGSTITHNDYLRLGIETGIVGFVSYLILIISLLLILIKKLKKRLSQHSDKSLLFLVFTSFASVIFMAGAIDNLFEATALQWAFWSMVGAILATTKTLDESNKKITVN